MLDQINQNEKKHTILVADDQEGNQVLLKYILEKRGYNVLIATDGDEAVEEALKNDPDLILMDVLMPGIDGYDACKILKENPKTKNIPIVIITSLNDVTDKVKGLEVGADDFMTKPPNEIELTARVKSLIRIKDQQKEIDQLRSDFTAMLVHDLRAPLTSILGFTDILATIPDLTESEKQEYCSVIEQSGKKMLGLINDILDASKLESGSMTLNIDRTPMSSVISVNLEKNHGLLLKKHIEIKQDLDPEIYLYIDWEKIDQVFTNLISNAVKFSSDHGIIEISLKKVGNFAHCRVKDHGAGISEEDLPLIFEKYKQASGGKSDKYKGTGLGLYISKLIMEAHKGSISVESKVGEGASFTLVFELGAN